MNTPKIELIKSKRITSFPSGSAIEFYNDVLYVVGDDASEMLLLDKNYEHLNKQQSSATIERIAKDEKIDLEAATIIFQEGKPKLLIVGSGSKENREKIVTVPLPFSDRSFPDTIDNSRFIKQLKESGIEEVNLEGVAATKDHIIFANRANLKHPDNHLIFTGRSFADTTAGTHILVKKLLLPASKVVLGVSGLTYDNTNDILIFTASTEETASSYDDGAIGDSYIGYIKNISKQAKSEIKPEGFINLTTANTSFKGEKIESVCIEKIAGSNYTLHLVSDNDKGATGLFKIGLTID